jgi:hypothetical protein
LYALIDRFHVAMLGIVPMQMATLLAQVDFDFDTTELVTQAFDEAWSVLQLAGGSLVNGEFASSARTLLASRVIELALQGERDVDRLIDGALDYLGDGDITGH